MHRGAPLKYKSCLLSLVAGPHTKAELKAAGFRFSNTQFRTAKRKAVNQTFSLSDYERFVPPSRAPLAQETKNLVEEFLRRNSRESCSTTRRNTSARRVPSSPSSAEGFPEIYFLEKPKRQVYEELRAEYPELKLSLSKFYKLCPKNFKKATKKTDMCEVCVAGQKAEKKLNNLLSSPSPSPNHVALLREEVACYKQHVFFKEQQQQLYNRSIDRTTTSFCVVVVDFKENIRIGGGPVEVGRDFYEKQQVSVLGFAVHYRDEEGTLYRRYVDYLSPILSHDSLFVTDCIAKLLARPFMSRFNEICFWCDPGPHFRSAEFMHFVFARLPSMYVKKIFLNYFTEHHGKSVVDGHFGVLTRWFSEVEATRYIHTIDDLIGAFRDKVRSNQNMTSIIEFDIYSRTQPRGQIHRLTVDNFKAYMSFVRIGYKLYANTLSSLDYKDYVEVCFKMDTMKDKRQDKYAPERQSMDVDIPTVMGPKSKATLRTRVGLNGGVPNFNVIERT